MSTKSSQQAGESMPTAGESAPVIDGQQWIGGEWHSAAGAPMVSTNPADQSPVWRGAAATEEDVHRATAAARRAYPDWWRTPVEQRIEFTVQFAEQVSTRADELAELLSRENGKPLWEAKTEVKAVIGKTQLSIDAFRERRDTTRFAMQGIDAVTRYKPYGVLAVLGPFNFPAHLPNGHIIPALIAGNTIVFKPSEHTPAVGEWMVRQWQHIGLPDGVLNLVQGGRATGVALANDPELDGLLFTGSSNAGLALHKSFANWPQKILALEMGGNNPLIAHEFADSQTAAYTTVLSAYLTAGQRCTCARRLIVIDGKEADELIEQIQALIPRVAVGYYNDPQEPFLGPVVDVAAGNQVSQAQQSLIRQGGRPLVELKSQRDNEALLSPGLIDVTAIADREDREIFGPLLQVIRVPHFDAAIDEANRTAYGLAAGLISDHRTRYDQFIHQVRAGVVNWNRQTTGASGQLPFGGCGMSVNSRPGGYFAADYCSWPVASMESETLKSPDQPMPGIRWPNSGH